MARVCLIHTVVGLVPVFDALLKTHIPELERSHLVDESLLKDTIRDGYLSSQTRRRLLGHLWAASDAGADVLLVTCSSIGPAADEARAFLSKPVLRIDEAMADRAVTGGKRVGVLATLPTTLEPTRALVERQASRAMREIEIHPKVVDGAFEALAAGDAARHDQLIEAELLKLARKVDIVVLAQASMARVASRLTPGSVRVPIISSPELGIERLKEFCQNLRMG